MDRDTFSHIRLWCPRPFGTYSQNKARSGAGAGPGGGGSGPGAPSLCKAEPSPGGGRRSLDGSGAVEMMLGGQEEDGDGDCEEEEEEEEEEDDAGSESENTPPHAAPELGSSGSSTTTQSQAPPPPPPPPPLSSPSSSCPPPGPCPSPPPSSGAQMEDGRVLLDTWYVIKPGNTKEKIAFFVAHQFSGAGLPRTSAMKVKGNWATDCSKAKRRRRCSSYDPPTRTSQTSPDPSHHLNQEDPSSSSLAPPSSSSDGPDDQLQGVSDTDLLSVAEMVALVEQRTAMALQGMVAVQQAGQQHQHTLLRSTVSDPTSMMFLSEEDGPRSPPAEPREEEDEDEEAPPPSPIRTDQELEEEEAELEQQESCRVAQAIAHFESQNLEGRLGPSSAGSGNGMDCSSSSSGRDRERQHRAAAAGGGGGGDIAAPPPPPAHHAHGRGEVRIAFRVSSLDPRSQSEPAGRPRCMFMSCGGGGGQAGARAKEKITCDLYQLVSPSAASRGDPGALHHHHHHHHHHADGSPDTAHQDLSSSSSCGGEKKAGGAARERVTGFHVEVVVTGAVDQCVFYGKDSTENVQEETVCFAMPGGGGGGGVGSSTDPSSDDPPPGQLFFLQKSSEEDGKGTAGGVSGMCSLDCANNNSSGPAAGGGDRPDSPLVVGGGAMMMDSDCSDPSSLCRLYRHVSHDFLEIRFQIQRLLEPRQYMLLLPDHIMVNIFSHLPTRALAALKCTCHDFKALIEAFGVRATDSRWNRDPLYRDDPCKQCKRQYERGDVSLCRWHPKPYHHDLPYGRSYWMCCRRTDKDTPGCRVGLHDNNWVQQPADGSQAVVGRAKREEARREEAR